MIHSLTINPDKKDDGVWSFYKRIRDRPIMGGKESITLKFEPGLNILVGDNGAGKSTILKYLGLLTGTLENGGMKKNDCCFIKAYQKDASSTMNMDEGTKVRYFDPAESPGLLGGQFTDFDLGFRSIQINKQSKGQIVITRVGNFLLEAKAAEDKMQEFCLLLDEPDDGFAPGLAYNFWENLVTKFSGCQIIATSQSILALDLPEANYIQISPNWIKNARQTLDLIHTRSQIVQKAIARKNNNNPCPF